MPKPSAPACSIRPCRADSKANEDGAGGADARSARTRNGEGVMANKVRVLVVGLGNMGRSHASAYHRNDGFEIVGLMSRSIKSKDIPAELKGYPLYEDFDTALA